MPESLAQAGSIFLTGALFIVVGVSLCLLLFLAMMVAYRVGHFVYEKLEGECDDCDKKRLRRERDERERVAEAERIIRQHDREVCR